IFTEYESKQYKISTTSSSSKKKLLSRSFKRNKVAIAFAIKRRFPFLQGLRDWGMLSKRQSLVSIVCSSSNEPTIVTCALVQGAAISRSLWAPLVPAQTFAC
uniref:HSR domain-containing protein n=1 Tax=Leptobrachium leishanense TaxID=445787 RepID=A0A8C5LUY5_9ANUR